MRRYRSPRSLAILFLTLCAEPATLWAQAPTPATPEPPAQPAAEGAPPAASAQAPTIPEIDVSDPMLEPPPPAPRQITDWKQALRLIRTNSTALRNARAQVQIARGQARQTLAGALPSLTGVAQINRHLLLGEGIDVFSGTFERTTLPDPATTWNAGLNLNVPLLAPKAWYDHGTAKDVIDLRQLEARDAERLIIRDVANAIIQVVTAERAAEVSRVSLKSALSNLELNRRRAKLGAASAVDVLRMDQEVARSRAQVIAADESLARARETLGLALGTPTRWGVSPNISLNALAEEARTTCQPEESITTRLDVRAAEANVGVAKRNVNSVDYLFVPTIDGVSSATYWSNSDTTPNRESVTWTIGAVLTWNIYDGGARYGAKQANRGQLTLAQEAVTEVKRQAQVEVDRALRNVRVAEENLQVSSRAAEIARQAARFAQITFLNGTGTSFDMVDTARTQREAELDVTIKEFELLQAKIAAFLALATCQV